MASVWGELKRRNVVRVAVAYAIVGWLLIEVVSTILPTFEAPQWVLQTITLVIILGFPLALILSWMFDLTPAGVERTESTRDSGNTTANTSGRKLDWAIIGLLVLAVGFMFVDNYLPESGPFAGAEIEPASLGPALDETPSTNTEPVVAGEGSEVLPNSVAVLLCANLSPNPDDAYFAAGIHWEILNQLVKLRNLNVIARTSVLQYGDAPPPIPQVAEELNVGAVMECSVRFAGNAIMVTAQLIDPATNSHLWSDTYPGDLSDLSTLFAIQADIAMNIANAVGAEFSPAEQESIEQIPTESREAYDYYLRSLSAPNEESAVALLDQAIAIDPNFALAYAKKAFRLSVYLAGAGMADADEAADVERVVRENAERALALDPTLGIAQAALAVPLYVMTWRGAEAEQAFQQAIQLNPNDVDSLVLYARFKRYRGDYDEVTRLLQRALELDPYREQLYNQLAVNYSYSGDWEAAVVAFQDALNRRPTGVGTTVGLAAVEAIRGNRAEAIRQLQVAERLHEQWSEPSAFRLAQMAYAYALADRPDDARRLFNQLEQLSSEDPVRDADWVRAYLAVGDYEGALQRIEAALTTRAPTDLATLAGIAANRFADPELEKPEFRELFDRLWLD